jgi:tetratricopeptide (TPR) repeat protein
MRSNASRIIVHGGALTLMSMSFVTWAAAQSPKFSNVDLCNGRDVKSLETQITGCTALIKSDVTNSHVLSIAFNNRGNAYTRKGEYELAIHDYGEAIKLEPNFTKPLNNRGVAYQKRR